MTPAPAAAGRGEVGLRLDGVDRVGDRHGALAKVQERVVVLPVSDADRLVDGQVQLAQRRPQSAALVHAGGKHHHRVPVEGDLQLQIEVPDRLEHGDFVGPSRRQNRAAPRERLYAAACELAREDIGHGRAEHLRLAAGGNVQNGAVLEDHGREQVQVGADGQQILEDPARDQHGPAARRPQPLERCFRVVAEVPVRRDRLVVVSRQRQVSHRPIVCTGLQDATRPTGGSGGSTIGPSRSRSGNQSGRCRRLPRRRPAVHLHRHAETLPRLEVFGQRDVAFLRAVVGC